MITNENLKRIEDFNIKNGLTDFNEVNELKMLNEEIKEFYSAKTIYDRIAELSDIIIVGIGTLYKKEDYFEYMNVTLFLYHYSEITAEIKTQSSCREKEYSVLISCCEELIYMIGFDPNKVLDETLKKIESREGVINADGKFQKTKTNYTPNYEKCIRSLDG